MFEFTKLESKWSVLTVLGCEKGLQTRLLTCNFVRGQDTLGNTVYVLEATVKSSLNMQSDRDSEFLRARTDGNSGFEGATGTSRHVSRSVTM